MSDTTPPKVTVTVDVTDCSLTVEQLTNGASEFYGYPHAELRENIIVYRFDGPSADTHAKQFQHFLERFPPMESAA